MTMRRQEQSKQAWRAIRAATINPLLPMQPGVCACAEGENGTTESAEPAAQDSTSAEAPRTGPATSVQALCALAQQPDSVLLSVSGPASGSLLHVDLADGDIRQVSGMSKGVASAQHSHDGRHFLLGSRDGAVRVYPLAQAYALPSAESPFWEAQVHDMHAHVTSVAMSFDSSAITTAASDGSVITLKLSTVVGLSEAIAAGKAQPGRPNVDLCTMAECAEAAVATEADTLCYTIEEAKQKVGEDAAAAAAESRKQCMRAELEQCAPQLAVQARLRCR